MSNQAMVAGFRAQTPEDEHRHGQTPKPTLTAPGLQIPLEVVAHSKHIRCSDSEVEESPSDWGELGTPNSKSSISSDRGRLFEELNLTVIDGRSWISSQKTLNIASDPSLASSITPSRLSLFKSAFLSFKTLFRRPRRSAMDQTEASLHSSSTKAVPTNNKLMTSHTNSELSSLVTSELSSAGSTVLVLTSPVTPNTSLPLLSGAAHSPGDSRPRQTSAAGLDLENTVVFGTAPEVQDVDKRVMCFNSSDHQLYARNFSKTSPYDFDVETCELYDEFESASAIPGVRGKAIGKGATATVKVMYKKGAPKSIGYAVKEFRKCPNSRDEDEYGRSVKSEFTIANSLNHPNIVRTVRLCTHNGRWNHVMEYCSYGEIFSLVQRGYFEKKDELCLFKQLLQGVAYLHKNGIAHRDIKLENLLLSEEGHLKITDFGVSEVFSGSHPGLRSFTIGNNEDRGGIRKCAAGICGSLPYIAPEVLDKAGISLSPPICRAHAYTYSLGEYDPRPLDVWSCAIVYLVLLSRGMPWTAAKLEDPRYARFMRGWEEFLSAKPDGIITDTDYPSCGRIFTAIPRLSLRRALLKMLHPDPARRISIENVMTELGVRTIECCCPDPNSITVTSNGNVRSSCKLPSIPHNHAPPLKKSFFERWAVI